MGSGLPSGLLGRVRPTKSSPFLRMVFQRKMGKTKSCQLRRRDSIPTFLRTFPQSSPGSAWLHLAPGRVPAACLLGKAFFQKLCLQGCLIFLSEREEKVFPTGRAAVVPAAAGAGTSGCPESEARRDSQREQAEQ